MPNSIVLPVDPSTLPQGFCPSSYQDMLNEFSRHQSVTLPSTANGVTSSQTKPADQSMPWLQLDSLGRPVRLYYFAQGAWVSLHPQVPGAVMLWTTALPTFTSFDGGDANPISAITGPMWEEVTELRAKFPIGAGTLPSGTVLAQGASGGQETSVGLQDHYHVSGRYKDNSTGDTSTELFNLIGDGGGKTGQGRRSPGGGGGTPGNRVLGNIQDQSGDYAITSGVVNPPAAQTTLPPYYVVFFLRRSARLFYAVT